MREASGFLKDVGDFRALMHDTAPEGPDMALSVAEFAAAMGPYERGADRDEAIHSLVKSECAELAQDDCGDRSRILRVGRSGALHAARKGDEHGLKFDSLFRRRTDASAFRAQVHVHLGAAAGKGDHCPTAGGFCSGTADQVGLADFVRRGSHSCAGRQSVKPVRMKCLQRTWDQARFLGWRGANYWRRPQPFVAKIARMFEAGSDSATGASNRRAKRDLCRFTPSSFCRSAIVGSHARPCLRHKKQGGASATHAAAIGNGRQAGSPACKQLPFRNQAVKRGKIAWQN